jgi:hypothetical protein
MTVADLQELFGVSGLDAGIVRQCAELEHIIATWEPRPCPPKRRYEAPAVQLRAVHRPILVAGEVSW